MFELIIQRNMSLAVLFFFSIVIPIVTRVTYAALSLSLSLSFSHTHPPYLSPAISAICITRPGPIVRFWLAIRIVNHDHPSTTDDLLFLFRYYSQLPFQQVRVLLYGRIFYKFIYLHMNGNTLYPVSVIFYSTSTTWVEKGPTPIRNYRKGDRNFSRLLL